METNALHEHIPVHSESRAWSPGCISDRSRPSRQSVPSACRRTVGWLISVFAAVIIFASLFTPQVQAQEHISKFLDQPPFNGGSAVRGTFTFTSSVPIATVALRGFIDEAGEFLMTLPVTPLSSSATETVVFPHFAAGGGWVTRVILVNPTDRTITGTAGLLEPGSGTAAAAPATLTSTKLPAGQMSLHVGRHTFEVPD